MANAYKEEIESHNKTQGEEIMVPCIECTGNTCHKVLFSHDLDGQEYDFDWKIHSQIIQCLGCKTISFRRAKTDSENYKQISNNEWIAEVFEKIYPSRIEGRKGITKGRLYLPNEINHIYEETMLALNSGSPILAGIGLRAILETVCKEKNATGRNLMDKLDDLTSMKILTPEGVKILHHIRTLGNKAAHEVEPHSEKQLGLAMDVTESLLKNIYIFPKQCQDEFSSEFN